MKIAIVSVTNQGDILAKKIGKALDIQLFSKNGINNFDIKEIAKTLMKGFKAVIFIASTGIAVRAIAPHIRGKDVDPAVLVIDSSGKFVISLLSGHLGKANELTVKVSGIIGAQPVITTATDNLGIKAPDIIAVENNLIIEDLKKAKNISAMLVEGNAVAFRDDKDIISIPEGYVRDIAQANGLLWITNKLREENFKSESSLMILRLIRKNIVIGIGCRKNYDSKEMQKNVDMILEKYNIDIRSVKIIATVDVKKDEKAINDLSGFLKCELRIIGREEIANIQNKYRGSDFVEKTIGVRAVCEPCVEISGARLLTDKISCRGMTICIGELD